MYQALIDKYDRLSSPIKASLWFTVSNVLLKGISFITLPIFSRIMTTSQYGLASVYYSWKEIFIIFCTLTLWGGVFNVVIVKNPDKIDSIVSSFQGLSYTITGVVFTITIFFINPISKLLNMPTILVLCMFMEVFAIVPYALWAGEERYFYRYKKCIFISVVLAILNPLIGYFAVTHTQYKAEARIITGMILNVVIAIILFIYLQKKGGIFYNKEYWKIGFTFNIILIPHYLSIQVLSQSDRIMINNLCGASDAGIYSVAYTFAMLLQLITSAINSSFTPWVYKKIRAEKYDDLRKTSNVIVLVVAALSIGMICIIPDIFRFMLPESYYPAIWVIPPVTIAGFFMFLYPLFGAIEFYYEENRYITAASIIGAMLNILLNYIFIQLFGFIAAAYTTLVCYIVFSIAHYIFMKLVMNKNGINVSLYNVKGIIGISALTLGMMCIITVLYNNSFLRWFFIFIIVLLMLLKRKKIIQELSVIFIKKNANSEDEE